MLPYLSRYLGTFQGWAWARTRSENIDLRHAPGDPSSNADPRELILQVAAANHRRGQGQVVCMSCPVVR